MRLTHLKKSLRSKRLNEADLKVCSFISSVFKQIFFLLILYTSLIVQQQDLNYLRKFVDKRRPHVIAICGESLEARYLKEDVELTLRDIQDLNRDIPVEIVDNEAAKVYMYSKQAMVLNFRFLYIYKELCLRKIAFFSF